MPEQENIDIEVKESDIKVDVYHSSGAGGQSVNTTDSAVRMTHIPTGIVVTCQNERSQIKNREKAFQILKMKIYEETIRQKEEQLGAERRSKIGTGDRSEKIRTYNYPQNRVTDHRINLTVMQLDRIMDGRLDEVIEPLITEDLKRKLAGQ
jgi:peptide chain release factor 1